MTLIPEWAPNIHPLLIHFPIVLLVLAPALDLGAILFKKQGWWSKSANLLYALAGISALVVYISGRIAADSVDIPSQAYTTLSTHANWALYTMILSGLNGIFRGFLFIRKNDEDPFQWYLIIPGLVIAVLLFLTADKGAKLVYAHGLGVTAVQSEEHHNMPAMQGDDHHQTKAESSEQSHDDSGEHSHAGGMSHESGPETPGFLGVDNFVWILGDAKSVNLEITQEDTETLLSLELDKQEVLFVLPEIYTNLEFLAKLNRDEFNGIVRLVHHVSDANTYDLLELGNSTVKQGRMQQGKLLTFDSGEYTASQWITLKVVGTKGHFRGYVNQKLVTHGHGADLAPGKLGIYLRGSGKIKLSGLQGTELQ